LHGHTPLEINAATEISFLPSLAQELSLYIGRNEGSTRFDLAHSTCSVSENRVLRTLPMHLLAEETLREGRPSELMWVFNNGSLNRSLSEKTHAVLEKIHRAAEERELSPFQARYLRSFGGPIPLGRLVSGIAGELLDSPLTPIGLSRRDANTTHFRWYLVDDSSTERRLHQLGSELDRLKFCRDVVEEGFRMGHQFFRKPLEAVVALGHRLGLVSGKSDERTAYLVAPHTPDITGEPLSIVVRPGHEQNRVPGLEIGWAHHDHIPRPAQTKRP
jgi:hypothetical protein